MTVLSRRGLLLGLLASGALPGALRAETRPPRRPVAGGASLVIPADPESLIARAKLNAKVAYAVIDPQSGQILAARNADVSMPPASTMKAVTALYALEKLGPAHRFTTRVHRAGDTLILAGGGDPELDTDALAALAKMTADAEKAAGRSAPSRFEVWGGALPHIAEISPAQAIHLPYNPTISGMILNFNRVHLGWNGGQLSLEARGARQSPRAYSVSAGIADRSRPLFTYDAAGAKENWTIARGAMGKSGSRWLPVRRPELYAGDVFQTLCRAQGLVLPSATVATNAPVGEVVAHLDSQPLLEVLKGMMEYSNNLTAEVVGLAASSKPDLASSAAEMETWLRAAGVTGDFHLRDHSGLSPASRVTAQMLARMVARQGESRGLRSLMRHIRMRDAKGKVMDSPIVVDAKTGTLNFVSNLTGYAQNAGGKPLVFAILTADEPRRAATEGQELPDGVSLWTRNSKRLQQGLIESWVASYGQMPETRMTAPAEVLQPG